MRSLAVIFGLLFAVGCQEAAEMERSTASVVAHEDDSTVYVRSDSLTGVIFRRNFSVYYPETAFSEATDVSILKHFMPSDGVTFREATVEEVLQFERDFFDYWREARTDSLACANGKTYLPLRRLDWLGRQYVGFTDSTGRPHLYVNLFPADEVPSGAKEDWRRHPVLVDDGGPVYFQLKYDSAAGVIYDIWQNGPLAAASCT